jgi:hypothetical protein
MIRTKYLLSLIIQIFLFSIANAQTNITVSGVVKEKYPRLKQLVGFVVPENIASRKIFERQGYLLDSSDQKKLKYIKQL